jgi:peptidoglycan/xylan/chitin deacetylase (PgdA/CDA1 family)
MMIATILMYHGFTDKDGHEGIKNYHGKHLHIAKFKEQIAYLKSHYTIISLTQLVDFCRKEESLPPRPIVITLDDGYRSNYTLGFPVLEEYKVPAAIFITTDFVDQKNYLWMDRVEHVLDKIQETSLKLELDGQIQHFDLKGTKEKIKSDQQIKAALKLLPAKRREQIILYLEEHVKQPLSSKAGEDMYASLSWDEIRDMKVSGLVSIGSHTCSHTILTNCSKEEMDHELSASKKRIEEMTGSSCLHFSYPNGQKGNFNMETKAALIEAGFSCGLTTTIGTNAQQDDVYELKRLNIHNSGDLGGFKRTLSPLVRSLRKAKKYFLKG